MSDFSVIVLAAGKGTRMNSDNSKVVFKVCNKPMINHVLTAANEIGADETIVVVGHREDQVKECCGENVKYARQEEMLGTGHAVMQAVPCLSLNSKLTLVLCGDTPLISAKTLKFAMDEHMNSGAKATVITAIAKDPTGYGRIVKRSDGDILKIVEQKDASDEERKIDEINSGIYFFETNTLLDALKKITNGNSQGEYYLTDAIEIIMQSGEKVATYQTQDFDEILGVNDRVALAFAQKIMQKRINEKHALSGVTFIDIDNTYIDAEVTIGAETVLLPGTILEGKTVIGKNCEIGPASRIVNSKIDDSVSVAYSNVFNSEIGEETKVGPYAYLRPNSKIGKHCKVGDFVEIKNSNLGDGTKASHLTYVGDADVGEHVNFGCGSITVNYNGVSKARCVIEDDAFIGCNTNLIAPVVVESGAYTAAGSTINKTVPSNSLAIARAKQENIENWVKRRKK